MLLYADDTILLSETEEDLQLLLHAFSKYCKQWRLSVNLDKTKIMVFSKRKSNKKYRFIFDGVIIQVVDSFPYLGILFNYNCKFSLAQKHLVEQARKAMYALIHKTKGLCLPIDIQLKLFDILVVPILLYSSEIWGFHCNKEIEKLHLYYLKLILDVRSNTPNYMVYGETGRFPLDILIKQRMLCFWSNLLSQSKLSSSLYNFAYVLFSNNDVNIAWLLSMKSLFDNLGLSYVWESQSVLSKFDVKYVIKQTLIDQFCQKMYSDMNVSTRGQLYSNLKISWSIEPYC